MGRYSLWPQVLQRLIPLLCTAKLVDDLARSACDQEALYQGSDHVVDILVQQELSSWRCGPDTLVSVRENNFVRRDWVS